MYSSWLVTVVVRIGHDYIKKIVILTEIKEANTDRKEVSHNSLILPFQSRLMFVSFESSLQLPFQREYPKDLQFLHSIK